jgi:hypothetical protein
MTYIGHFLGSAVDLAGLRGFEGQFSPQNMYLPLLAPGTGIHCTHILISDGSEACLSQCPTNTLYLNGTVIHDLVLVVRECVSNVNGKMTVHYDDGCMSQGKVYE